MMWYKCSESTYAVYNRVDPEKSWALATTPDKDIPNIAHHVIGDYGNKLKVNERPSAAVIIVHVSKITGVLITTS